MKRFLCAFIAVLTLSLCACGNSSAGSSVSEDDESVSFEEELPQYESDKEFHIGTWCGVPGNLSDEDFEKHYELIKAAGFNYTEGGLGETSDSYNVRALAAAEKVGINQYILSKTINDILLNSAEDEETLVRQARKAAINYSKYKSFAGLKIKDEPSFAEIKNYENAKKVFDAAFPGKTFYVNLFPVIAGTTQVSADYKNYIKEYVARINTDYVSYDHYPLKKNTRGNYLIENFLYNMLLVRQAAPEKEMWTFLQSIAYGANNRTLTSLADATFQVNSFLAFGGVGIQWFCYWSPPEFDGATTFGEGCIDRNGNVTETYNYVKSANLMLRSFEDVYFNFNWKGFMTKIGTENKNGGENANFNYINNAAMKTHGRISAYSASQDTLTGVFEEGEGRDGFMVVNFTEPSAKLKDNVKMTFNNATRALVIRCGERETVVLKKGVLEFTLDEGEGCFVIPLR